MRFRHIAGALIALATLCAGPKAHAIDNPPTEFALKAALIFNFALYTDWPEGTFAEASAVTFCVMGEDPFGASLDALNARKIQGVPVKTLRISSLNETKRCNVLFVAASEHDNFPRIAAAIGRRPTLTVSEKPSADGSFPVIVISPAEKRFTFDINQTEALASGLRLRSNLLRLARSVN
jgi:hypothetical protein